MSTTTSSEASFRAPSTDNQPAITRNRPICRQRLTEPMLKELDRDDRVRACYQHSALKWVMSERMTNQSLRERFHLPESKSAIVSQVIAAAIEAGQVKPDEKVGISRKFARYLPFWA